MQSNIITLKKRWITAQVFSHKNSKKAVKIIKKNNYENESE